MRRPPNTDPGRAAFVALLDGEPEPTDDPRPNRPRSSIDQGVRGTNVISPREAWREYLADKLR